MRACRDFLRRRWCGWEQFQRGRADGGTRHCLSRKRVSEGGGVPVGGVESKGRQDARGEIRSKGKTEETRMNDDIFVRIYFKVLYNIVNILTAKCGISCA